MAVNDAGFVQIVRGHFDVDLISNRNADKIFSHFTGNVGKNLVSVGQSHPEHGARQDLGHISSEFDWFFFGHKIVWLVSFAVLPLEINFFCFKKRVDNYGLLATLPRTMKSETLNGILTYFLGVLCILGVFFVLRAVFITHEARSLSSQAVAAGNRIAQVEGTLSDAQLYNQKYQDPALTQILQSAAKSANH